VLSVVLLVSLQIFLGAAYSDIWALTGGNPRGVGEGYNIRSQRQTGFPLFEFTPSKDTLNVLGTTYSMPDELFGKEVALFRNDSEVQIIETFEQFQNMKSKNWGINVGLSIYGVGVSVGYSQLKGQIDGLIKNNSRAFNVATVIWHTFDLEVDWRSATLDSDFLADIKLLPATYGPSTQAAYMKFINFYGTHFFDKAGYGCKWNFTVAFDRAFSEKSGSKWTQTNVGIAVTYSLGTFGIGVGMNFSKFKNTSRVDGEFQKHSTGTENLLGGDELLLPKGLDVWMPSCRFNRALLVEKSSLKPIAELIKDPQRKPAMMQALKDFAVNPAL